MTTTMNISLTPELASLIQAKVASGLYSNASEVVRDAVRQMESHNALYQYKLEQLKQALEPGIQDAIHGRFAEYSLSSFLDEIDNDTAS